MRTVIVAAFLLVGSFCFAGTSLAQVVVVLPRTPVALVIDIAIQGDCPIKMSVAESKLSIPMFNVLNSDTRAVRGYVILSENEAGKHISTTVFPNNSLAPGKKDKRGISASGGSKLSVMVDFVLFEDGTSWGADQVGRSKLIASYIEGRDLAESRLRSLISDADHAVFLPKIRILGSSTHGETSKVLRPVNAAKYHKSGYDNVLYRLREMKTRTADAQELARKLELMQTP